MAVCLQANHLAYAGYDVVSAKTVENENLIEEEKAEENYIPTYNDIDEDTHNDGTLSSFIAEKYRKFKYRKTSKSDQTDIDEETPNTDESSVSNVKKYSEISDKIEDRNKFKVNADKISYDEEDGNVYATGHVEIISNAQNVILKADEAILDKNSQTIKLQNNVKIIQNGMEMEGEYMLVDLNEENILMENPTVQAYQFTISAQQGYLIANDIEMINGLMTSDQKNEIALETKSFQRYENVAMDYRRKRHIDRSNITSQTKQSYEIDAKEIVLTSYKDHNSIVFKKANVYFNKHKIVPRSDIEIISDKQYQSVETSALEAGSIRNFGTYVGYGFLFRLPRGQILKLVPALTYGKGNFGVGLMGRHRSRNHFLEAGWTTSTENLVVNGKYYLGNGFSFRYGRNAYMPEGFFGARRSGYAAQLQFQKSYEVGDLGAIFNHGLYAGFFSDYKKHKQESHAYATTRFRYNMELRKDFFKRQNPEQDLEIRISGLGQASATVYGSGQTYGVARIGPYLTTRVKKWESSIGYMVGGVHGDSPFRFDKYRYGKNSIMLNEKFNFNDKIALGFRSVITPKKDNIEHDLLTEARLYAIVGPEDLKVCFSYDFVRSMMHLDFLFLLGTDSSKIKFNKLTTKNIDGRNKRDNFKNQERVKIVKPEVKSEVKEEI